MSSSNHVARVRLLYKSCLKLHRALPHEMKSIGDVYIKEEFRRNKTASVDQSHDFLKAWSVSI
jgi:hypothetical protein